MTAYQGSARNHPTAWLRRMRRRTTLTEQTAVTAGILALVYLACR